MDSLPNEIIQHILILTATNSSVREFATVCSSCERFEKNALAVFKHCAPLLTCSLIEEDCSDRVLIQVVHKIPEHEFLLGLNRRQRIRLIETDLERFARLKQHFLVLIEEAKSRISIISTKTNIVIVMILLDFDHFRPEATRN